MPKPSLRKIRNVSKVYFCEDVFDRSKTGRKDSFTKKRFVVFYIACIMFDYSVTKVGIEFGFNHSNVIHGVRKVKYELYKYDDVTSYYEDLMSILNFKFKTSSPAYMIYDLLKSKTLDVNVKVELRNILTAIQNENNNKRGID